MFSIGQKIVCVDGKFTELQRALVDHVVVEGQTYVVRAVRVSADFDKLIMDHRREVDYGVLLVGIVNSCAPGGLTLKQEPCYRASRFRGLKELQKTATEAPGLELAHFDAATGPITPVDNKTP